MEKSIDREVGELVVTVMKLVEDNARQYSEISAALSGIKQQFATYSEAHNAKHAEERDAIESRVTSLERRLKVLEDEKLLKKGAETSKLTKFLQQFAMSFAAILATGVAAFIFWLFVQFITKADLT